MNCLKQTYLTELCDVVPYYTNVMCLKATRYGPKATAKHEALQNANVEPNRENLKHLCVLPIGHTGKCCHKFSHLFIKKEESKKLMVKFDLSIYNTPGNDDYVYKNRASRLFQYVLSCEEEKKIRNKSVKLKCAIPKKDASTPQHIAHAALDWIVYFLNIPGVTELLLPEVRENILYKEYFSKHKTFLSNHFGKYNRRVFDEDGNTICCVTRHKLRIVDVADIVRDNRTNIKDTDLQMGHNISRSDEYITIRGCNLLPQTRRGNLIIGENTFTNDVWINELKHITMIY